MPSITIDLSSSLSLFLDRREPIDSHFRWKSIKIFLYMACTYSYSLMNFDIFSKICYNVRIYDFLVLQIFIGATYLFMDFFVKLYTRRLDSSRLFNPLIRGVLYGLFLQTALWTLLHAEFMADIMRFLAASFRTVPIWSKCIANHTSEKCIPAAEVVTKCEDRNFNKTINLNETSAHFNYLKSFTNFDNSVLTTRFFVVGLVWLSNFFVSSVSEESLLKIFKLTFLCRLILALVMILFITLSARNNNGSKAFTDLLNIRSDNCYVATMEHLSYIYGIGYLGLYDFGTMSPFTMVDNSVIIFTLLFSIMAFIRSWIVRVLFLELTNCVKVEGSITIHYLIFAVFPMSAEFFKAQKLYIFYIYMNMAVATTAYLAMLTLTMSKILHAEFRSVKQVYIIGLVCCVGFGLSLPFTVSSPTCSKMLGLRKGLNVITLYLGGIKVALVMWVYGVKRFATDIHFWLGFEPTRFWTVSWMILPIILWGFFIRRLYLLTQEDLQEIFMTVLWIAFTMLVVAIIQIKTIVKYLLLNNIGGIFSASVKYGPPDADDRKRRKCFNESIQLRQCTHNCHALDEMFDCNHLPLMQRSMSKTSLNDSSLSLTNIFDATSEIRKIRKSTTLHVEAHH